MWKRSFVATTVALGDTVDDALAAIGGGGDGLRGASVAPVGRSASHVAAASLGAPNLHTGQLQEPDLDVRTSELVAQLRAPHRATRAAALAKAVHEIVLRIDEGTLR
jgi:hypothetical protein